MSNESLASWKSDASIALLGTLPLQTFDSAIVLVDRYLAANGGWVPEDPADPVGPGAPATGENALEAANSITQEQLERIYNIATNASIKLNFNIVQNLDPGLADNDIAVLIEETVGDFIASQFGCTVMELDEILSYDITVDRGGNTTADQRVQANAEVTSGDKLIDPVPISLSLARSRFDLDENWNVTYIYNEPGQDIVAMVERYVTTSYDNIDTSTLTQYVIKIDATTYELASGVVTTRNQ